MTASTVSSTAPAGATPSPGREQNSRTRRTPRWMPTGGFKPMPDATQLAYLADLNQRLWTFRPRAFHGKDDLFEHPAPDPEQPNRPPVFLKEHVRENVI